MKLTYLTLLFLFIQSTLYCQFNITGTIKSDSLELEGVNISVLNTNKGTISNSKGKFRINDISATDIVRFSMVGYQSKDTLFTKANDSIKIALTESITELSEIELVTENYVLDILKKINNNLATNYPSNISAFNAMFRKQIVQNGDYLFLGNAQISVLSPEYLSDKEKKVILNGIELTENKLEEVDVKIAASALLNFSPEFEFITSPEYFNFTFLKSIEWDNQIYFKIAFKTKEEYWEDYPFDGIITVESSSFAISEIEWNTYRENENKKGFNKEKGIYKGVFITNQLKNKITYTLGNDKKWHFNYKQITWDLTITYEKYPNEEKNLILKSDLYRINNITASVIENLKSININADLFNKQKSLEHTDWKALSPILPDFQ